MKAWGLYSSLVDPYTSWELLEVFPSREVAEQVKAGLVGRQAAQYGGPYLWHEDPAGEAGFDDLHVLPLELRAFP